MSITILFSLPNLGIADISKGSSPKDIAKTDISVTNINKLGLTEKEIKWLQQHKLITVAALHGWMPIEFMSEGHQFRGISIDYLRKIELLLGVKFQTISANEDVGFETADMISAVSRLPTLENTRFVALDHAYLTMPLVIYTRTDNNSIHNINDLKQKRVAVFKTGAATKMLSANYPTINLHKVDIAEEALAALVVGKVDAYVGNQQVVNYNARLQGFKDIKEAGITPFVVTANIAVREDWPELKSILQKCLIVLQPEKESILDKWNLRGNMDDDYQLIYAFVLSFLIALLLWLRTHRLKNEMTNHKRVTEERLWRKRNFDQLTNLPNRQMFSNCLLKAITKSERTRLPVAILHLDMDNFKAINEQMGHSIGDQLIIKAAERITRCVRAVDITARLGGDEFAILLGELKDIKVIDRVTEDILETLSQAFILNDEEVFTSVSVGITIYPNDSNNIDTLLSNAEQAMYEAKRQGRNRYQYFTASMQEAAIRKHKLIQDLRTAISTEQFTLYYQPIVNLETLSTHKAEALIRWIHPEQGLVSPQEFIPLAEETGMITQIGDWVYRQAARDNKQIRTNLIEDFQTSVNVSPLQFKEMQSASLWLSYLEELQLSATGICFEITEGLLLDAEDTNARDLLTAFRNAGAQISIDDFGTGYSSLSYLKKLDIDYVKIDRSFVQNLAEHSEDMALCEAIIVMSHKLGFKVIAEGIETKEQMLLLKQAGCDFGQGYYFSRPIPLWGLNEYLEKSSHFLSRIAAG